MPVVISNKKYILILGGTGAMGGHLVQILSEQIDVDCYVTSRSKHEDYGNIYYLHGNAHDEMFLAEILALKEWDAIVDFMVYDTPEFKNKVDCLLAATKQYVFISSARVYADSDELLAEEFPRLLDVCADVDYLKTDEYALTKARQEDILSKHTQKNWTIVRPSKTYGKDRIQLGAQEKETWLHETLAGYPIVVSNDILSKCVTFSSGLDVAQGIYHILGDNRTLGECFNVTGDKIFLWNDILALYEEVLTANNVPYRVIKKDKWESWQGGSFYQVKYSTGLNRKVSNRKLKEFYPDLKFENTEDGIRRTLDDFLKEGNYKLSINANRMLEKARYTRCFPPYNQMTGKKHKLKYFLYKLRIL